MRDVARDTFERIRSAYEVLSSAPRRQLYDLYGPAGLRSGLELGPVLRSAAELRAEVERAQRREREAREAALLQQASHLNVSIVAARAIATGFNRPPALGG